MEVKKGYKMTEVGAIPEIWKCELIELHARRGSGHTPSKRHPEYYNGGIVWISLADSHNLDRGLINQSVFNISKLGLQNSSAVLHPEGTVIISRDAGIGKSAVAGCDLCVSQHFIAWVCNDQSLNNWFLYYWLQFNKNAFERIAIGSTIKTIGLAFFKLYKIPLPPINEQRAIATALSDVDRLLSAYDQLIAKKKAIKQGAMQELLTGRRRLEGFEGEWTLQTLGKLSKITMGQSPSSAFYNTEGNGLPLIQGNADIRDRKTITRNFTSQVTKKGNKGDIIMSVRAPVGEVAKAGFDCCLGRGVCSIHYPNEYLYQYLLYIEPNWSRFSSGSTFDSINSNQLFSVTIKLPIDISEQHAIAQILTDMDAEIAALERQREKYKAVKAGMMQELLTGKTRLV